MFQRYRNGILLELNNRTRYGGATVDQPSLVIHSAHREDTGSYSCVLENIVGASESLNAALLDIYCKLQKIFYSFKHNKNFHTKLSGKIGHRAIKQF